MSSQPDRLFALASIACAIVTPTAALGQSDAPLIFAAASKWHVSYDKDGCRLARAFGSADAPVSTIFSRYSPGDGFQLAISGAPFKRFMNVNKAYLQFGPTEAKQDHEYMAGELGKGVPALIFRGLRLAPATPEEKKRLERAAWNEPFEPLPLTPERKAAVTYLEVSRSTGKVIRLATGPMKAPLAALDKCIEDLMTTWGIDVARHARLSRKVMPAASPATWVTNSDYPADQQMRGEQGIVNFRLSVDEKGAVSACHIQQSTRPAKFDEIVCRALTRRAKFHPALDAQGNALASYYPGRFIFAIQP